MRMILVHFETDECRASTKDHPHCPKCDKKSGDDWRQCRGSCPRMNSPHYDTFHGKKTDSDARAAKVDLTREDHAKLTYRHMRVSACKDYVDRAYRAIEACRETASKLQKEMDDILYPEGRPEEIPF